MAIELYGGKEMPAKNDRPLLTDEQDGKLAVTKLAVKALVDVLVQAEHRRTDVGAAWQIHGSSAYAYLGKRGNPLAQAKRYRSQFIELKTDPPREFRNSLAAHSDKLTAVIEAFDALVVSLGGDYLPEFETNFQPFLPVDKAIPVPRRGKLPLPSREDYEARRVEAAQAVELEQNLRDVAAPHPGMVELVGFASSGKTTTAFVLAFTLAADHHMCLYIDLGSRVDDGAEITAAFRRILDRGANVLVILDNAHREPELVSRLIAQRELRRSARRPKLLIISTTGAHGSTDTVPAALLFTPEQFTTTIDADHLAQLVRFYVRKFGNREIDPPESQVKIWLREFGGHLHALSFALMADAHHIGLNGNWHLARDHAHRWISEHWLHPANGQPTQNALDNLKALSVFGEQDLELQLRLAALPHPHHADIVYFQRLGVVRETGHLLARYELTEPGWGSLLLGCLGVSAADRQILRWEAASRSPQLAFHYFRRLKAAGADTQAEGFLQHLLAQEEFAHAVPRDDPFILREWTKIPQFRKPIFEAFQADLASGSFALTQMKTSGLEMLWAALQSKDAEDIRSYLWDEIKRRADQDTGFFDAMPPIERIKFFRHASDDGRDDVRIVLTNSLKAFLARADHAGLHDLEALLALGGLKETGLDAAAAVAIAGMLKNGGFPLTGTYFSSILAANTMLKKQQLHEASAALKSKIDEVQDEALLADAAYMSPVALVHVLSEFRNCKKFIGRVEDLIERDFPALFDHHLRGTIAGFSSFLRTSKRLFPAREGQIDALVDRFMNEIEHAIRRSNLLDVAFATRFGTPKLNALIAATLDQAEWHRRQPLSEATFRGLPRLVHMLAIYGNTSFSDSLARLLAERADERDLGGLPGVHVGTNDSEVIANVWHIAGWCADEALARKYLDRLIRRVRSACMREEHGLLANVISNLWLIPRERLDWVDWQGTLIGRIRKHLRGNDEAVDESSFIRLVGAVSILLGLEEISADLAQYVQRIGSIRLSSDFVANHRETAMRVERNQYHFWLGIRCLERLGGLEVSIARPSLTKTLELWRANSVTDTHPFFVKLNSEMIIWLEEKLGDQTGETAVSAGSS